MNYILTELSKSENFAYVVMLGTLFSYVLIDSPVQTRLRIRILGFLPARTPSQVVNALELIFWVLIITVFSHFTGGILSSANHAFMAGFTAHASINLSMIQVAKLTDDDNRSESRGGAEQPGSTGSSSGTKTPGDGNV